MAHGYFTILRSHLGTGAVAQSVTKRGNFENNPYPKPLHGKPLDWSRAVVLSLSM